MLFNSIDFALFLPIIFVVYWLIPTKNLHAQNLLLVVASFIFYGWWNWRFLFLIIISILVDFTVGLFLGKTNNKHRRKALLWTSILVNLGLLAFFKYFNFFLENVKTAFSFLGHPVHASSLSIILPVGISFYTFQTLSYTIDVYKGKQKPTQDFIAFSAFVGFFPQLVAGPIERSTNLLPQFLHQRTFQYSSAVNGMRQILWGLFKKMVIADSCAEFADMIFSNSAEFSGSTLALGAFFFAFQIYGDFSGYSDIAIGTARLFGFTLMRNFSYPYFSRDVAEFWRRWHISLSTWFRDYLYIPLGGSRNGLWMQIRNTFVIFLVSGFWHGANWTFVFWGFLHALYFLPLMRRSLHRKHIGIVAQGRLLPSFHEIFSILSTFGLILISWVFFRAHDLGHAFSYLSGMFSKSLFSLPLFTGRQQAIEILTLVLIMLFIEWTGRTNQYGIEDLGRKWPRPVRWLFYSALVFLIGAYTQTNETPFIYFQF